MIEDMPFDDGIFDVAISNCVLNLMSDKLKGYKEINRVLKKGGKLIVSDIALK